MSGLGAVFQHEIFVMFCRARDDGHHYGVTSKCCGVTITTCLVEWTLFIREKCVVFKNCQA